MKINKITDGARAVDVEGMITDIEPKRAVNLKDGRVAEVATATLSDDTGDIKLSLWDEMIERVSKGTKVKISNGYTNKFHDENQLNIGRYGKLELL